MIEGDHTFYYIQQRQTHKSPWLKPKGKLKCWREKNKEWHGASWDFFGKGLAPSNLCRHACSSCYTTQRHRKAGDEAHDVWAHTGYHGWRTLKYALAALKRCRKEDAKGTFDSRDGYKNHEQAVRHEFRLVKVTLSYHVEPVTIDDAVEAA